MHITRRKKFIGQVLSGQNLIFWGIFIKSPPSFRIEFVQIARLLLEMQLEKMVGYFPRMTGLFVSIPSQWDFSMSMGPTHYFPLSPFTLNVTLFDFLKALTIVKVNSCVIIKLIYLFIDYNMWRRSRRISPSWSPTNHIYKVNADTVRPSWTQASQFWAKSFSHNCKEDRMGITPSFSAQ